MWQNVEIARREAFFFKFVLTERRKNTIILGI